MKRVNDSDLYTQLSQLLDSMTADGMISIFDNSTDNEIVVLSAQAWNDLKHKAEEFDLYDLIERGLEQIKNGQVVTKTMEELETMENE